MRYSIWENRIGFHLVYWRASINIFVFTAFAVGVTVVAVDLPVSGVLWKEYAEPDTYLIRLDRLG